MRRSHQYRWLVLLFVCGLCPGALRAPDAGLHGEEKEAKPQAAAGDPLELHIRKRVETHPGTDRFHSVTEAVSWEPRKTAIVVCDMWDKHWCQGASRRVGQMAPRMNEVLTAARDRGVFIIHCPSDTMDFYADTPQRKLAQAAPAAEPKVPLQRWCRIDLAREGALPIDDSDGGCDCEPQCKNYKAWSRQIPVLTVAEGDAVTDSAEAYNLLQQRGIDNVIVMGVHTNMCVLGRPFSIRQLVYQGKNVVLMRDLTDTMYNPRKSPFVSHFTGTDLVVEHIEENWCPTITSVDFLGGTPYRSPDDKRPHLVAVIAEDEYESQRTVPEFALKNLGADFKLSYVFEKFDNHNQLPGIEVLADADVALFAIRRRVLPKEQMEVVRQFIRSGKPLVALRTTSHAFSLRDQPPPEGYADWPEFDQDVLGGHYTGHFGNKEADGAGTVVWVADRAEKSPLLNGVPRGKLKVRSWLYKTRPLAASTELLMRGQVGDAEPEPVTWTNRRQDGGRVFYTSLGHHDDFKIPAFVRLLRNGVYWAAEREAPTTDVVIEQTATAAK